MNRVLAVVFASILTIGMSQAAEEAYSEVRTQNPEYRPNTVFSAHEDLGAPVFDGLVERYGLKRVVEGESDEFRRILLLRNWLHRHIVIDRSRPAAPERDPLGILDRGPGGGRYSCGHFEAAQNVVMNAMGYVTRSVLSGPGDKDPRLSGSHGSNEVWCNSLRKWVMIDAEYDSHFEKDGVPLSALEIRESWLDDGAAGVERVQGIERMPVPRGNTDQWGLTPKSYAFISWHRQTNRYSVRPEDVSSEEVVYDDEFFRANTWYRGGRKHWAYDKDQFLRVGDRGAIYWTPNVLDLRARIEGNRALIDIESCTPNLKEYQIRREDGDWEPVGKSASLTLSGVREVWLFRSVNLAGVTGPEYRLVLERKQDAAPRTGSP